MENFTRRFLTEWRKLKLPFEGKTFIAAVSGGADSVSLLLVLKDLRERKKLNNRFIIAHFNHNLREDDSKKDAEFVKSLCVKFNFELALGNGNVSKQGNIEQNARIARYEFLRETAKNLHSAGVLTAHTINDQAETFLINLIRGSGLRGLSGMSAVRMLENEKSEIQLIRPLLNWAKREDTESFCHLNGIDFRYDTMNEDLAFKRVRIRKVLLPLLLDFNPKIIETLAQTAKLLDEEEKSVNFEKKEKLPNVESEFLQLKDLHDLSKKELYQTLRNWLKFNRKSLRNIDLKHIEAIERLIFSRKSGKISELPNGEKVVKENGKLCFQNFKVEK